MGVRVSRGVERSLGRTIWGLPYFQLISAKCDFLPCPFIGRGKGRKSEMRTFGGVLAIAVYLCAFLAGGTALSPGSSLYATSSNRSWSSPNDTFSLGFLPAFRSSTFIVAISYSSIPIWIAGGVDSVADSTAAFHFLPSGNLRLVNGSGAIVWESGTAGRNISAADLNDSGNLELRRGTTTVWSTFENPSHTIVPSQNFTASTTLRNGLYSFTLQRSGNLTLRWNDSIVYWTIGLNSSFDLNLTSPSLGLQSIGIVNLYDPLLPSNGAIVAYSSDYAEGSDIFRFLRLDDDGNLRIYSGPEAERWAAVQDQCEVYGYCGNFGICSYDDSGPICGCPSQNFDPVDQSDKRKGCKSKIPLEDCRGSETMLELEKTMLLTFPPESSSQVLYLGISACRLNCLTSSPCIASTSLADGSGRCYLKLSDYLSGYQSPTLPSSSYVKICGHAVPNSPIEKAKPRRFQAWIVVVVVAGVLSGLVLLEGCIWWWCCRNPRKFSSQYALLEFASGAPVQFSYKELLDSTKGFKDKLGEGGFGAVYKGILANRTVVAVKRLEGIEQGEKQFRMEVATISSTHHLNLVRLIGFCSEGKHRLLVYEFLKNGSLDTFLFHESSSRVLDWESRFKIAIGTARGITYLHEECRDCIIHCDIKPENILLDENLNARVSDFGLAKLINPNDHRYRTLKSVRGTRGYLAPEWLANLPITSKSDVYSYGMILLELVSGRRNYEVSPETNQRKFSSWAYAEFEKGDVMNIVDKKIKGSEMEMEQVKKMIAVSFWCIQEQASQRPRIGKVLQMLEGISEIEKPPPPRSVGMEDSRSMSTLSTDNTTSRLSTFARLETLPSSSSLHQSTELQ